MPNDDPMSETDLTRMEHALETLTRQIELLARAVDQLEKMDVDRILNRGGEHIDPDLLK